MTATTTVLPPAGPEVSLDVRGLAPPEPMQRVLEALARLPAQAVLVVRIHREPVLLYQLIEPNGWNRFGRQLAPDDWQVRLWRGARDS